MNEIVGVFGMDSLEKIMVASRGLNESYDMNKKSVRTMSPGASYAEVSGINGDRLPRSEAVYAETLNDSEFSDSSGTLGEEAIPACPPEFLKFVEDTSLERLVFWKLENLVKNISMDCIESVELNVLDKVVTHVEKPLFALVLRKTAGNLSVAAKLLGCNRNTLHRKLREFCIVPKDLRKMLRKGRIQKLTRI